MTFGDKLRELRTEKGWAQKRLAEETGFAQAAIARWELGDTVPALDSVETICKALGVKLRVFEGCEFKPTGDKRVRGRPKKE